MRELKITHLYPELLNLYGDKGNIASLKCRAEWRDISVVVTEVSAEDKIDFENTDILFLGGGGDRELKTVLNCLTPFKNELSDYIEKGGVMITVCDGFPLLGKNLVVGNETVEGLGILDITTALSEERLIGDVLAECDIDGESFLVSGFENRAGVTDIKGETPFLKVVSGNGETDGVIKNNLFASYFHGPLLPKNPELCDIILKRALVKKYGDAELTPLDDEFENEASEVMRKRLLKG
ncbi:MAG: glutamine amidotransferase [Clostridia bacterium]|nr:glutamine amidotransferase [Clostridia bacterium]